jgi:hypothetical protein
MSRRNRDRSRTSFQAGTSPRQRYAAARRELFEGLESRTLLTIAVTPAFGPETFRSDSAARLTNCPVYLIYLWS